MFLSLVGNAPPRCLSAFSAKDSSQHDDFPNHHPTGWDVPLKFFGISLRVVEVSGGLPLAAMGWKLLNQEQPSDGDKAPEGQGNRADRGALEQCMYLSYSNAPAITARISPQASSGILRRLHLFCCA